MDEQCYRNSVRRWRWGAVIALCLLLAVSWIVFDGLFQPRGIASRSVEIPHYRGANLNGLTFEDWLEVEVEYRHDANAPAGEILSQAPTGGSRRKLTAANPRCKLTLTVSLGEETVTLPDLIGRDAREAESRLREMGLRVTVRRVEGAYPEGTVFDMEPRVGTLLPIGTEITLTVSAGLPHKSVRVPELLGLTRSEALVQLWLSGLTVGQVVETAPAALEGRVVRQSHRAGTLVVSGTEITLYIGAEDGGSNPEETTEPHSAEPSEATLKNDETD